MLLYHGPQTERVKLLKQIRRPQGPLSMYPVVITSFEISMIDRKHLQVRSSQQAVIFTRTFQNGTSVLELGAEPRLYYIHLVSTWLEAVLHLELS